MIKVLVVTRNYPPLWGGMERLNKHLVDELSQRFEVRLVAPSGAERNVPENVQVKTVFLKPLLLFLLHSAWKVFTESREWKPDVVVAGSGLTAPHAVLASKLCGARSIAYAHGLDMTVSNLIYRALWYPSLKRLNCLIANSRATAKLAREKVGISADKIQLIHPGVQVPDFKESVSGIDRKESRIKFCEKHSLSDGPMLLSVGRLTERKGLRQFVEEVMPTLVEAHPRINLVIIGEEPTDSLHAVLQTQKCIQMAADGKGIGDRICFLGKRFGGELTEAYQSADVHIFPVREITNDPEGFGMVAIEAAAYGLPTVAYATGGVVDAVGHGESGRLARSGDVIDFSQHVLQLLESPCDVEKIYSFATKFSWAEFGRKVEKVIRDCC